MKRLICSMACCIVLVGKISGIPAHAKSDDTVVIRAQGNPNLVDFFALSGKRANLRIAMVTNGLDAAFSEWLRYERPYQYRRLVDDESKK